jgi:hypothetical protein
VLWIAAFFLRNKNRLETSPLGRLVRFGTVRDSPSVPKEIGASPQSATPAIVVSYFSAEIVLWRILGST